MNLFDLTGKIAVITGASSGIGADAAMAYAQQGADVAVLARRVDKLEALAEEIKKTGRRAIAVKCDVTNEDEVKKAVEEIMAYYGKIDILFNNAGMAAAGTVETYTQEQWDNSMNLNVKGIYLMSKYVVPHMREQQYGKIVNTASVNAVIGAKSPAGSRHVYNASKAAVRGLTMGMAATYMQDNITVNSIGPGLFKTEMTQSTLFAHEGYLTHYNAACPAGRPGAKGEVSGTVLYLSSDASSYVTGQHILIDGGISLV